VSRRFRLSVIATVLLVALALAACGGKKTRLVPQPAPIGSGGLQAADDAHRVAPPIQAAADISLDEALAELDALDAPDGVDEALFAELKDALSSQLESRFSNRDSLMGHSRLESRDSRFEGKFVSTPPTGEANRVNDLAIADNGDGTFTLSWHYKNLGDYDQNGIVGISDITPLARHFGEEVPADDINRNSIQAVIDGSSNGVVDIADIVVLAQRLATQVAGYAIEGAQAIDSAFSFIQAIGLEPVTTDGRLLITHTVSRVGFKCVRVSPTDASGAAGEPSNAVFMPATGRGDWYMFGRDAQHSHASPYIGPQQNPTLLWKSSIDEAAWLPSANSSPVIGANGAIYIHNSNGIIYAISPDGAIEWECDAMASGYSNPAVGLDGTVYIGCKDGYLRALSPDGILKWEYEVTDVLPGITRVNTCPLIAPDGTIYAGAYGRYSMYLHAVNPDGTQKWIVKGPASFERNTPAAFADGVVVAGGDKADLYAILPDGTVKWQIETEQVRSGPSLDEHGSIYVRTFPNLLHCYSKDGTQQWTYSLGGEYSHGTDSAPVVGPEGMIYIGNNDYTLTALDADGSLVWKFETGFEIHSSVALGADGTIYFGSDDGYFYALNPEGSLLWRLDVGASIRSSAAIGADGTIYFVTEDGYLCAVAENYKGQEPVAVLRATPVSGSAPLNISFDASQSYDPDGSIVTYEWDPDGDGSYAEAFESETSLNYMYSATGMYTAGLRVTDNSGLFDTTTVTIIVNGASQQGDWWMFGRDPQHTRQSSFVGPQTASVKWKYKMGPVFSSPAIAADGTVYVGSNDYHLYALNPDGTLQWKYKTDWSVRSSPAIAPSGVVYVGSDDSHFYAINPDGSLNWRRRLGYTVVSSPVIAPDGTVYVGCSDTYLYAFYPDGNIKWQFKAGDWIFSSPAIGDDGTIYAGSTDGYLYAIDPDGSMIWCFRTGGQYSSPTIATDGTVYALAWGWLYALRNDGLLKWVYSYDYQTYSSTALCSNSDVYFDDGDGILHSVLPDGTLSWQCQFLHPAYGPQISSPAVGADGTAYLGYRNGIVAISSEGEVLWRYETSREVDSSPALAEDGTLYVGCEDGYLYAFADEIDTE